MARRRPRPRGWYVKDGDPPGTERFWDGEKWGPQPRQMKNPPPARRRSTRGAAAATARRKVTAEAAEEDAATEAPARGTIWARITARSTDALILILPYYYLIGAAFSTEEVENADGTIEQVVETQAIYLWIGAALFVAYEVFFTGMWGWTPGKRVVGLAVVARDDGRTPPGWAKAVMRSLPLLLASTVIFLPLLWLACVILMRLDRQNRSVFDFLGGTYVVATSPAAARRRS